jgi:hypothetical protein
LSIRRRWQRGLIGSCQDQRARNAEPRQFARELVEGSRAEYDPHRSGLVGKALHRLCGPWLGETPGSYFHARAVCERDDPACRQGQKRLQTGLDRNCLRKNDLHDAWFPNSTSCEETQHLFPVGLILA